MNNLKTNHAQLWFHSWPSSSDRHVGETEQNVPIYCIHSFGWNISYVILSRVIFLPTLSVLSELNPNIIVLLVGNMQNTLDWTNQTTTTLELDTIELTSLHIIFHLSSWWSHPVLFSSLLLDVPYKAKQLPFPPARRRHRRPVCRPPPCHRSVVERPYLALPRLISQPWRWLLPQNPLLPNIPIIPVAKKIGMNACPMEKSKSRRLAVWKPNFEKLLPWIPEQVKFFVPMDPRPPCRHWWKTSAAIAWPRPVCMDDKMMRSAIPFQDSRTGLRGDQGKVRPLVRGLVAFRRTRKENMQWKWDKHVPCCMWTQNQAHNATCTYNPITSLQVHRSLYVPTERIGPFGIRAKRCQLDGDSNSNTILISRLPFFGNIYAFASKSNSLWIF